MGDVGGGGGCGWIDRCLDFKPHTISPAHERGSVLSITLSMAGDLERQE